MLYLLNVHVINMTIIHVNPASPGSENVTVDLLKSAVRVLEECLTVFKAYELTTPDHWGGIRAVC